MSARATTARLNLRYVKTIGIVNNGFSGRGFANPVDLAVSRDGRVFVLNRCDPGRGAAIRIGICNLDEEYLGEFGNGYGDGDGQFVLPTAIAFDSRERLHVADEHNHRITVFDSSGVYLSKWGVHGSGEGQFNGPSGIAFDSQDHIYVVDQHNNRVQKYTGEGEYVLQWGEQGDGEGHFDLPWGVTGDSQDNVFVADWRNDRIQKFTANGEFLAAFGESGDGDGQFHRPTDVAVDEEGYIYVADWGNERVQVLDRDGGFVAKLRGQATLSKWAEDFFASNPDEVRERDRSDLVPQLTAVFDTRYQVSSQTEPYFWGPVSVALDGEGRLYVTESNRHRFQVYQKGQAP